MSQPLEQSPRGCRGGTSAGESEGGIFVTEEDVLGHRQSVDQIEFLIDRRDAVVDRGRRIGEFHDVAAPGQVALVRTMCAGQNLDER